MTGLRERKKREARHRIIRAAEHLFAKRGIDNTTMDEIADRAGVSVATVYNYFGNKSALLLAGVAEETDGLIERGARVLARPGSNPVRSVQRLMDVYAEELCAWDRGLLREVLGAAFQRGGGEELTVELVAMDQRLIDQMAELLENLHAKGRLRQDIVVQEATLFLFSILALHLFMFISIESFDPKDLREQISRQIEMAFTGLAPNPETKANSK